MKEEQQNKLFEKYPKIFRQKDLSMQQTAMCWGITCGDGWYNIIDTLCHNIKGHSEDTMVTEATQVKEKYGGLRFYYDGGDELIRGMVRMAEGLSYCTCENCGSPGTQNDKGWISTLCDPCRKNIMEIRNKIVEETLQRSAEDHKNTFQKLADSPSGDQHKK
tara:strand:- start:205 stop:690 length:486 start_codon:yes stop_codon:yes gene_type:complete